MNARSRHGMGHADVQFQPCPVEPLRRHPLVWAVGESMFFISLRKAKFRGEGAYTACPLPTSRESIRRKPLLTTAHYPGRDGNLILTKAPLSPLRT